jgi:Ras family protein T1
VACLSMANRGVVKIVVCGDPGVGKTSLISTAAKDTFDVRPAPVLPPTRLPAEFTPDHVPMLVTDTPSRPEDQQVKGIGSLRGIGCTVPREGL